MSGLLEAVNCVKTALPPPKPGQPLETTVRKQDIAKLLAEFGEVQSGYPNIDLILSLIYTREFKSVKDTVKKYDAAKLRELREVLNEHLLPAFNREWTSHGITRSFRYWTNTQKKNYLMFTNWVIEALEDEFLVCFGYGAVLAAVRDNDLLPHDDDLDLIVLLKEGQAESYKAGFKRVFAKLENFGFSIRGEYVAHRHVCNERFFLDVFVGMEEEGYASWHPGPRKHMRTSDIFPAVNAEIEGVKFPIPKDPEGYLKAVYGENWRVPLPGWSHNFDPAPYKDWFFRK